MPPSHDACRSFRNASTYTRREYPRVATNKCTRVGDASFTSGSISLTLSVPEKRTGIISAGIGFSNRQQLGTLDLEIARVVFGNDLDDEQFAWMAERMVPEAPGVVAEPVDLAPLRSGTFGRTWIRPVHDAIVDPARQLDFAGHVGGCEVVDLDAAHMCMISQPAALAALLAAVAGAG